MAVYLEKQSSLSLTKSALHLMQLHYVQEPMIMAPKLITMDIH